MSWPNWQRHTIHTKRPVKPDSMKFRNTTPKPAPPYISDHAKEIRANGGTVWQAEKLDYGFILRASFCRGHLRVVFPPLAGKGEPIPTEGNSITYVADNSTVTDFRLIMNRLSNCV